VLVRGALRLFFSVCVWRAADEHLRALKCSEVFRHEQPRAAALHCGGSERRGERRDTLYASWRPAGRRVQWRVVGPTNQPPGAAPTPCSVSHSLERSKFGAVDSLGFNIKARSADAVANAR